MLIFNSRSARKPRLPFDQRVARDTIEQAIRLRDKLLVVLSNDSVKSEWVEDEVEAAFEEERKREDRQTVLFPIKIDDAVQNTDLSWAQKIRRPRHIGDFTHWKDHDAYQQSFAQERSVF